MLTCVSKINFLKVFFASEGNNRVSCRRSVRGTLLAAFTTTAATTSAAGAASATATTVTAS